MSGTSLDGLDIALCRFEENEGKILYSILKAETIPYENTLKQELFNAYSYNGMNLFHLNASYGQFLGQQAKSFLNKHGLTANAIASHGHTIFHQPQNGFTTQIGNGANIAAETGLPVVCDFRSLDVALGGQGAPLVPIGDELLFGHYTSCLNLGGIANISFKNEKQIRTAFDICVCNMALNFLAQKVGKPYDQNGSLARNGKLDKNLLDQLNSLDYFQKKERKSLGYEYFEKNIQSLIENNDAETGLSTFTEHIAIQITDVIKENKLHQVLITGGGAYNTYLIERLKALSDTEIIIPDDTCIQFKEALIFAFLGYLRLNNKINTLNSVTGASQNSIGGAVYMM
jgi:anhydro-N-acetylmuramic acid kinase